MATDGTVDTYDLVIEQGKPLTRTFTFTVTATGAARTGLTAAEARIKASPEATTALLDMDSYLTVDGDAGTAVLSVSKTIIDALTFTKPAYWDMFATFAGVREKMFAGRVRLVPNVTD